jgi:hypothetical protein
MGRGWNRCRSTCTWICMRCSPTCESGPSTHYPQPPPQRALFGGPELNYVWGPFAQDDSWLAGRVNSRRLCSKTETRTLRSAFSLSLYRLACGPAEAVPLLQGATGWWYPTHPR